MMVETSPVATPRKRKSRHAEAGLESRTPVHCSIKSEIQQESKYGDQEMMRRWYTEVHTCRTHLPTGNEGFSRELKITRLCVMISIWTIPIGLCAQYLILNWWPYVSGRVKRTRSLRHVLEGNILTWAPSCCMYLLHHKPLLLWATEIWSKTLADNGKS